MVRFEMICGCMSSSKTTTLVSKAFQFKSIGKTVLCISPIIDTRTKAIISKNEMFSMDCLKVHTLSETIEKCLQYDIIAIDETQFFPDVVQFLREIENRTFQGTILLSTLLGDSNMKRWESMDNVMPMMDSIQFMHAYCAICKDGTPAPFTMSIVPKDSNILIGGSNEYVSVCRNHFIKTPQGES